MLFHVAHKGLDDKERGEKGGNTAGQEEKALGEGEGKAEFDKL